MISCSSFRRIRATTFNTASYLQVLGGSPRSASPTTQVSYMIQKTCPAVEVDLLSAGFLGRSEYDNAMTGAIATIEVENL